MLLFQQNLASGGASSGTGPGLLLVLSLNMGGGAPSGISCGIGEASATGLPSQVVATEQCHIGTATGEGKTADLSVTQEFATGSATGTGKKAILRILPPGYFTPEEIATAVMAAEVESGLTVKDTLRIILAALSGETQGVGTSQEKFLSVDATKPRITATFDGSGNRSTITLDPTD